jgi:hypothetical protein
MPGTTSGLLDELAEVYGGDGQQAGDNRNNKQPFNSVQQPCEHRAQDPNDDERDNDLHGATLPSLR